jgi:WD40 repeat protein/energy-coupling factor transporter ATP-binding protein EcfA2
MEVVDKVAANPFPGLRPFQIDESHLFFGREGQSDEVLLKLSKSRFVGVIGPSGSGKSSFIYCGVLPILYGGFLTDASPNWEVVVTRPGGGPIDNMAEALIKNNPEYISADPEEKRIKRTIFSTLLRSSSLGLVEAVEQSRRSADVNYLILVDQFEELFRFKDGTDPNSVNESLAFINLLMEAVNYPDAPIYVAITMRSDFIGECAQFPELTRKINDSHYLIPQMTRDQKRRAIEGPVAVGGATIAPRLSQQLLNDLGDNPDQLPILQHALMRTWSYWAKYRDYDAEALDLKHYEAIGTMSEALSMHANEAYDELDEEQKRVCEILFKAITEKRGENFGIRRPTRLNEIAAIADCSEEDVVAVIEKFREPGRSLLTPGHGLPIASKSMVDISHESLMRIWVRLKNWVDDEADAVQMYTRLAEAAAMYQVGKAGLWRPPDLQLALNWQAKHKPTLVWGQRYNPAFERTMIFLEYSKKEFETEQRIKELEQKRKLQRARIVALVLAGGMIVALVGIVFAFIQKTEADKARANAERQEILAKENANRATLAAKEAQEQRDKAEEEKVRADKAAKEALEQERVAKREKEEADKQRNLAIQREAEAEAAKQQANESAEFAIKQKGIAEEASTLATQRQYIATAKSIAVKSKEQPDKELQSLLAQQAFIFNNTYKGYEYDNDIYTGLFRALKKQDDPLTKNLLGHDAGACRIMISDAKTRKIYSGGSDGRILAWTYRNNQWSNEVLVDKRSNYLVYSLDISPDGNYMIAGGLANGLSTQNYVELYDLRNMASPPKKISGFTFDIDNLHFTNDGKGFFARDNAGNSIKYSDLSTVKEVIKSTEKINGIVLSKDGKKLAGAGNNGTLFIWDIANNFSPTALFKTANETRGGKTVAIPLTGAGFTRDGKKLVFGDAKGLVRILTLDNSVPMRVLSGHTSAIEQITFNHTGTFMATASYDKTVRLWNLSQLNQQPIVLDDHADWVRTAVFTLDDEQLLAGMNSNSEKSSETIHAWPTNMKTMSNLLCNYLTRNLTQEEWEINVDKALTREVTCGNLPDTK